MWWIFGTIGAAVAALVIIMMVPITVGTYYSQKASCHNFATTTNRETKFRVLVKAVVRPCRLNYSSQSSSPGRCPSRS